MRALLVVVGLLACKGKAKESSTVTSDGDGLLACEKAVTQATSAPLAARPKVLLDGCAPCGDWSTLLRWNVEGGPKREAIEKLMVACDAFCTGAAKDKFIGGIDSARGTNANTPWRWLGRTCGDKVGAHPDDRYMSAPYFALDRIGRRYGKQRAEAPDLHAKLAALDIPLPAMTVTGVGVELPTIDAARVTHADTQVAVTVVAGEVYVGTLPRAKLTADGISVALGEPPYPGELVGLDQLAAKLAPLSGGKPVLVLAPAGMGANQLLPMLVVAKTIPFQLAVRAPESPEGWSLPATLAVPLDASSVGEAKTVQDVATALAAK